MRRDGGGGPVPSSARLMFFLNVINFYAAPVKAVRPDAVAGGWPGAWTYAWTYADATAGPDACPTPSDG